MGFHRIRIWLLVTALALGIALPAGAQLMPEEKDALKEALFIGNITEDELKYERVQFKDPFRMRIIDEVLNQPIETADKLMALHNVAKKSMSDLIRVGRDHIIKNSLQAEVDAPGGSMFPALPESIRASVGILVGGLAQAQVDVQLALSNLTDDEQRDLIESLPVLAVEEPKVTFEFTRKPPLSRTQILALIRKVDLDKLLTAGLNLSTAVEKAMVGLRIAKADVPAPVKLKVNAVNIVVLGSGDDQFQGKGEDLVIDLGGNDQFTGRIGGGIGKASVFIAIGGNDSFDLGDGSGGSGVLGIGIMRKVGGRDSFRGKSLCFGAGLCGVGGFAKEGGDDFYDAVSLSEGFAMFGVGACIDTSGNDHYTLGLHGQGDSRTLGVGWLVDRKGDDVYSAGGISLNSPLFKDIYYSWAQGSSSGYREDTGGVSGGLGMLTDLSGDDTYISQTYAQAASYWYSVGTLFDGNGHDTYTGYHYVQASAMHACGAFLFDLRGDDGYLTKFGASHAIGHDYGVAF
ncbi:MAG: hypothetical protein K8R88_14625, partial [Armatimonadetes bacterium]|nr:hypothetical protein [Armatimonadota bacterium]